MKQIEIKAGERKRIIFQFSNSLQQTHIFSATSLDSKSKVSGVVEIKGSNWIFPKQAIEQQLNSENEAEKKAWDTFYSVYVTPKTDTKITLTSSPIKNLWIYIIFVLITVAIASSLFFSMG